MGSLIVSLANNFDLIIIGRAIQGFGASGIFPVASALVGDLFPLEKRGRILGLIGAVLHCLGAAFIGLILMSLPEANGFKLIFIGVSALILIMFFLSFGIKNRA